MGDSSGEEDDLMFGEGEDWGEEPSSVASNDWMGEDDVVEFGRAEEKENKKKKQKKKVGFYALGLSKNIMSGVNQMGYRTPTPIQQQAIPLLLEGRDVVAMARTGSGKTAAFLLPLLEHLKTHSQRVGVRGLILSPTRELAIQTFQFAKKMAKKTDLRSVVVVGGHSLDTQFTNFALNPDIVVATPGRMAHHLVEAGLSLRAVEFLVFDEADRLFEMGFAPQLHEIMAKMSDKRQTVLVSATMPAMLIEFARAGLNDPQIVRLDSEMTVSPLLQTVFFTLRMEEKTAGLLHVIDKVLPLESQTLVFCATRHHAEYLSLVLTHRGISNVTVYGAMDQTARKINVSRFTEKEIRVMVVTDLAARGIDIPLLDNVINYDFPARPKVYVHRVGRVARAGRTGTAYSLVSPDEMPFMIELHLFLGCHLKNKLEEGEEFDQTVPHFGGFPTRSLDPEIQFLQGLSREKLDVVSQQKSMKNAYKLYYKTREKQTPESVRRAKELTTIFPHPLFLQKKEGKEGEEEKVEGEGELGEDFYSRLRNFRPPQTILEIKAKEKGAQSEVITLMQERREKKKAMTLMEGQEPQEGDEEGEEEEEVGEGEEEVVSRAPAKPAHRKKMTKSERKRKRQEESEEVNESGSGESAKKRKKEEEGKDSFYMEMHPRSRKESFQETHLSIAQDSSGVRLDDLKLDLTADDNQGMGKRKNAQVWDRKKKKFIQAGSDMKSIKKRNEAGALVAKNYESKNVYKEWQHKTKARIPYVGDTEDPDLTKRLKAKQSAGRGGRGGRGGGRGGGGRGGGRGGRGSDDKELRSKDEIIKHKKTKAENIKRHTKGWTKEVATDRKKKFEVRKQRLAAARSAPTRSKTITRK